MADEMQKYKLLDESDNHFIVEHPDGTAIPIAKNGLEPEYHDVIRGLAQAPLASTPEDTSQYSVDTSPSATDSGSERLLDPLGPIHKGIEAVRSVTDPIGAVGEAIGNAPGKALWNLFSKPNPNYTPADSPNSSVADISPSSSSVPASSVVPANQPSRSMAQASNPALAALNDIQSGQKMEAAGIRGKAGAESQLGEQNAKVYETQENQIQTAQAAYDKRHQELTAETEKLYSDTLNQKVDPNHFWASMSTGNRIIAAISLALGGIGGGLTGKGGNVALDIINKAIDRDIEAQKGNLENKKSLLSINLQRTRDLNEAEALTRSQLSAVAAAQVQKNLSKSAGPIAQANAQVLLGQLKGQWAQSNMNLSMMAAANSVGAGPSAKVRFLVPEKHQEGAYKELGALQKTQEIVDSGSRVFDAIARIQNVASRVGSPIQSKKQIDALVEPYLGQLAHETDGRVTPQEMEQMRRMFPAIADDEKTRETKRNALRNLLRSKGQPTPILDSYGISAPAMAGGSTTAVAFTPSRQQVVRK